MYFICASPNWQRSLLTVDVDCILYVSIKENAIFRFDHDEIIEV